jgi:hypothetical protein
MHRRNPGAGWIGVAVAVAVIIVVAIAIQLRSNGPEPSRSSTPPTSPTIAQLVTGQLPSSLLHPWQRSMPGTPGADPYKSGTLVVASGALSVTSGPDPEVSKSSITYVGLDSLVIAATAETVGCAIGDLGNYAWALQGKDTAMTLTAIGADACAAREEAVAGFWARSDLPGPPGAQPALSPGTHVTAAFNPFGDPATPRRLSYSVPEGWLVDDDLSNTFALHHPGETTEPPTPTDTFVSLFAQPRIAADFPEGAPCGPVGEAPGVESSVGDLVAAIQARPGLSSATPQAVTIGGFPGQMVDLEIASSWTTGCRDGNDVVVAIPVLVRAGSTNGPIVAIGPDRSTRIILVDLGAGRTLCIALFSVELLRPAEFHQRVAEMMPIVESFGFPAGS